jgi:hypothetical protein
MTDALFVDGHTVVAGDAIDHSADRVRDIDFASFAAVSAQEILVAGAAVTFRAVFRHLLALAVVPVAEGRRTLVGVGRSPHSSRNGT